MTSQRQSRGTGKPAGGFGFSITGDKRKRLAEYPCVSRLRQRRLLVFLWIHKFSQTLRAFTGETDAFMDVLHLHKLTLHGQWSEAIKYLSRFLPSDRPLGVLGRALHHFLRLHKAIDDIVAGKKEALSVTAAVSVCSDRFPTRSPALARLRAIFSALIESKTLRDSVDLMWLRCEASSIMHGLVTQTSELKDYMRPCGGSMNPQNVLPLGFSHACLRPRRHLKKQGGQVPASVVAGLYLQKKKMLPSLTSSDHSQELTREALVKAKEWLVELIGRSTEAGKSHKGDPVQSTCSKGAPGQQNSLVTLPRPAGYSRFKPVTNLALVKEAREWILYLTEERLEAWPEMPYFSEPGAFAARLSQTMPDAFTRHAESSSISSDTPAGIGDLLSQ